MRHALQCLICLIVLTATNAHGRELRKGDMLGGVWVGTLAAYVGEVEAPLPADDEFAEQILTRIYRCTFILINTYRCPVMIRGEEVFPHVTATYRILKERMDGRTAGPTMAVIQHQPTPTRCNKLVQGFDPDTISRTLQTTCLVKDVPYYIRFWMTLEMPETEL